MVKLAGYEERRPAQLSGGQRQRVALARALVNGPKVLLLDEPLGALDLKLREQMQEELKALQKQLGITFVFVTHDQGEALSMADRVAVFNDGQIVQVGSPGRYLRAAEVAFRCRFRRLLQRAAARVRLSPWRRSQAGPASGRRRSAYLRPARKSATGRRHADGKIKMLSYQGAVTRFSCRRPATRGSVPRRAAGGDRLQARRRRATALAAGSAMVTMEEGA